MDPAGFYDDLADEYHLIFADWEATVAWQAGVITGLLRDLGLTTGAVLDASCGIGTQALGLARAGFSVTATDVSRASVERCAREAAARGLTITTAVADLRVLDVDGPGNFDAALSFDNALPHLLDDADLHSACAALRRVLRPGGVLLASIRDYDEALSRRPSGDLPRRYAGEDASALSRAALTAAFSRAGFEDVVWQMPQETGFYQPIVAARAAAATPPGRGTR